MRREQIQIRDKEVEVEKATNKKEGQQMEQKVGRMVADRQQMMIQKMKRGLYWYDMTKNIRVAVIMD